MQLCAIVYIASIDRVQELAAISETGVEWLEDMVGSKLAGETLAHDLEIVASGVTQTDGHLGCAVQDAHDWLGNNTDDTLGRAREEAREATLFGALDGLGKQSRNTRRKALQHSLMIAN